MDWGWTRLFQSFCYECIDILPRGSALRVALLQRHNRPEQPPSKPCFMALGVSAIGTLISVANNSLQTIHAVQNNT